MNRLLKSLLFFWVACSVSAVSLQAVTQVTWNWGGVDQVFDNPANWTGGPVDINAELYVDTATDLQYPVITAGHAVTVDGIYLGNAAPGRLDITGTAQTFMNTLRMGACAGTSTLNLDAATLNKSNTGLSNRFGYVDGAIANVNMTNGSELNVPLTPVTSIGLWSGAVSNWTVNNSTMNFCSQANGTISWQWIVYIGNAGGTGVMNMTDSHLNQYGSSIQVGQGQDPNTLTVSDGTLNMMGASTIVIKPVDDPTFAGAAFFIGVNGGAQGTVNMYNTSTAAIPYGALSCGNSGSAIGTLTMHDSASITCASAEVGVQTGTGTVDLFDHSAITVTSDSGFVVGNTAGVGQLTLNDTSVVTTPVMYVGKEAGGLGTVTFNGGTLNASANTADFLQVTAGNVYVGDNGGTINVGADGLGHALTVGASAYLQHGGTLPTDGGLTKTGVGTLLCNGSADYNGDTRVNQGSLGGSGYLFNSKIVLGSGGNLTPGDPASLGYPLTAAALDATAGGTITNAIDASGISNYLDVTGTAILTNTHFAINLVAGDANGTYTLLTSSGLTASGLVLDFPIPDIRKTLALDTASQPNNVLLQVSGTLQVDTWTGADSNVWAANGPLNWSNGLDSKFMNWDSVVFNSTDSQPNVSLNQHVYVPAMTVSGASNYVISGSGMITGISMGTTLTKSDTGSIDFQTNGNSFDALNINGGAVAFTGTTTFTGTTLNLSNNGSVDFKANSGSVGTITADSGQIKGTGEIVGGDMTMSGSGGTLTISLSGLTVDWLTVGPGTVSLTGSGNVNLLGHVGDIQIGSGLGTPAKLSLNDNSVFTVGQGNVTVGTDGGDGTLEMTGSSTFRHLNNNGSYLVLYVGVHAGSTAAMTMTGGSSTTAGSLVDMGPAGVVTVGNDGGTATLTMRNYSQVNCLTMSVGAGQEAGNFGNGTLKMYDHSSINATSDSIWDWVYIGNVGSGSAELNDYASITTKAAFDIGGDDAATGSGTVVLNGNSSMTSTGFGMWVGNGAGATGEVTMNDFSTITLADEIEVPWSGIGKLHVGDGNAAHNAVLTCANVLLGWGGTSVSGVVDLNAGGTIITSKIYTLDDGGVGPVQSIVNFNGGTLMATVNNATFINNDGGSLDFQLNVLEGGAKIDSNGNDIGTALALTHAGVAAIDGGLEKMGAGSFSLTGPINYTGPTVIDAGKLIIGNGLTTNLSTVTGAAGTLEVQGTSVVNVQSISCNTLTIGAGSKLVIAPPSGGAVATVPEPSTVVLLLLVGAGLLLRAWCKASAR